MTDFTASRNTDAESSSFLLAIESMNKTMTEATLASTQASLVSLGNQMRKLEEANSSYDHRLSQVEQACMKMQVLDLEAGSRRQNIKMVGLPVKIENKSPAEFLENFIPEVLGASNFPNPVVVDGAHRLGKHSSKEGARPRGIIARIHHFKSKRKYYSFLTNNLTWNKRIKKKSAYIMGPRSGTSSNKVRTFKTGG